LPDDRSHARDELRDWARAPEYWDRAIRYLKLARIASDQDVQRRFVAIARHYRALALAEEREARLACDCGSAATLLRRFIAPPSWGVGRGRWRSGRVEPRSSVRTTALPPSADCIGLAARILAACSAINWNARYLSASFKDIGITQIVGYPDSRLGVQRLWTIRLSSSHKHCPKLT
jgi:hypothetical protein